MKTDDSSEKKRIIYICNSDKIDGLVFSQMIKKRNSFFQDKKSPFLGAMRVSFLTCFFKTVIFLVDMILRTQFYQFQPSILHKHIIIK